MQESFATIVGAVLAAASAFGAATFSLALAFVQGRHEKGPLGLGPAVLTASAILAGAAVIGASGGAFPWWVGALPALAGALLASWLLAGTARRAAGRASRLDRGLLWAAALLDVGTAVCLVHLQVATARLLAAP